MCGQPIVQDKYFIMQVYLSEEFTFKNRYINFYQFEIFAIKAAEKQRK